MHSYDDVNFLCRKCGETFYHAKNTDRIAELVAPQHLGGGGLPTCPICGQVSVRNNGGYSCLACSGYYELPNDDRADRTLHLMPHPRECMPNFMAVALVLLAGNLVVAGALFFGG